LVLFSFLYLLLLSQLLLSSSFLAALSAEDSLLDTRVRRSEVCVGAVRFRCIPCECIIEADRVLPSENGVGDAEFVEEGFATAPASNDYTYSSSLPGSRREAPDADEQSPSKYSFGLSILEAQLLALDVIAAVSLGGAFKFDEIVLCA